MKSVITMRLNFTSSGPKVRLTIYLDRVAGLLRLRVTVKKSVDEIVLLEI